MTKIAGRFIWHELHTGDVAAASAFYSGVVGWSAVKMTMGGVSYTIFKAGDDPIAAVIHRGVSAGTDQPVGGWVTYIGVENVDAAIDAALQLGAKVRQDAVDAPEIGRFAILSDLQGAIFGLFNPTLENRGSDRSNRSGPGHVGWRELYTSDPDAAFDFYASVFGWQRDHAFDMGPAGRYQLFSIGGQPAGGIMRAPPSMRQSAWNPFVQVEDIDSVEARVAAQNGHVFDGLREVPGGDWTVKCFDAQGYLFAMTGRRKHG